MTLLHNFFSCKVNFCVQLYGKLYVTIKKLRRNLINGVNLK